jgi:quinol monooxygenase YgiN
MYGRIAKIATVPGKRDEMISILLESINNMPGCLSYIVAKDPVDGNGIWVTEVWDSQESHRASLSLPAVKEAIPKGKALVRAFEHSFESQPVGGVGLDVLK